MSVSPKVQDQRIDQFGRRSRRRRPLAGQASVFVPEEVLREDHLPLDAEPEAVRWRGNALAALYAFQAHGYRLLLQASPDALSGPGRRSAGFNRGLLQRMAQEAEVHPAGLLAWTEADVLPALMQEAAAAHGLDLRRAWFLSCDETLGMASRRTGCRSVRLLEPGRAARRRWPLLRGHVPMKLMDALLYILRCDGHLSAGQSLPAQALPPRYEEDPDGGAVRP